MADGISGIHLFSELNEGKKVMPGKKFCDTYPTSTATTLRLTETYHGTGRLVCGDSWSISTSRNTPLTCLVKNFDGVLRLISIHLITL